MRIYNRFLLFTFTMVITAGFGLIGPKVADSKIITNVPSDISGEELKAIVIDDFENASTGAKGWEVKSVPKKFESSGTEEKLKMKNPVPTLEVRVINGFPNDMAVEEWSLTGLGKKKEKCLGVHYKFRYPGTNSIHILPPPEVDWKEQKPVLTYNPSTGKDEQERGLQLPGKARAISLWVHGRGTPYHMEVWVKDYQGNTHILKFGSVDFVGWRPLKVFIPSFIPMETDTYPQTRVAKITRFVLRVVPNTTAEAMTEESFFFVDQIKVLTDTFEVNYDGQDLHKAFKGGTGSKDNK